MSENFTRKSSNFLNMNQKILEVAFSLPLHTKPHPFKIIVKLTNLFNKFPGLPSSKTPGNSNTLSPSEGWTIS